jgi:hypothetical protein
MRTRYTFLGIVLGLLLCLILLSFAWRSSVILRRIDTVMDRRSPLCLTLLRQAEAIEINKIRSGDAEVVLAGRRYSEAHLAEHMWLLWFEARGLIPLEYEPLMFMAARLEQSGDVAHAMRLRAFQFSFDGGRR